MVYYAVLLDDRTYLAARWSAVNELLALNGVVGVS
jgi:hypothetical protein